MNGPTGVNYWGAILSVFCNVHLSDWSILTFILQLHKCILQNSDKCKQPEYRFIFCRFYFPGIDRKKSERILLQMNIENHTFLIRDGSEKGKCALSVRKNSRVDHFKIYFQLGDYSLEDSNTFESIEDLVNYYSETTSNSRILLSKCISKGNIRSFHNLT